MNYSFVMQLGKNRILPITDETAVNLFRLLEIDTLFDAVLTNFVIEGKRLYNPFKK